MPVNVLSRRMFLAGSAALAGSLWLPPSVRAQPAVVVVGKDPGLLTLSAKPLVMETPLELLAKDAVTPTSRLFVRNNFEFVDGMTLDPRSLDGWTISLTGLLEKPVEIRAGDLKTLDQESVEMVVQCSGNGRSLYSKTAKTEGTQWGRGGVGSVTFKGVRVAQVFERMGVKPRPEAVYITANGKDEPPPMKDDFEHSLLLTDVLKHSLLALEMNGQPLPALHGGPVRLVTPGFFGTMHIKWLTQLRFEAEETKVDHQLPRYRMPHELVKPGTDFEFTFQNSRPNYRMNVKSQILTPLPGAKLSAGETKVVGVAFNDGAAAIEAVLVSIDKGQSWKPARLSPPKNPTGWTRWEASVSLGAGSQEIWSRAIDRLGRSQPLDGAVYWNPHGYEWNGVEKIPVAVG
jgi:sulfite oxidase